VELEMGIISQVVYVNFADFKHNLSSFLVEKWYRRLRKCISVWKNGVASCGSAFSAVKSGVAGCGSVFPSGESSVAGCESVFPSGESGIASCERAFLSGKMVSQVAKVYSRLERWCRKLRKGISYR
jgi:hypothetical protein